MAIASRFLNDAEKQHSVGELEPSAAAWGFEQVLVHQNGKQVKLFTHHKALEPLLKKNKTNKQYGARQTRSLDRLNHFEIVVKCTIVKNSIASNN